MDQTAIRPIALEEEPSGADQRGSQRFTLLIRAAKLLSPQGEFICVIRDVSTTGVSVKLFHQLPQSKDLALELQSGECFPVKHVWQREGEAGFEFAANVEVDRFISEVGEFPKRGIRLAIEIPVMVQAIGNRCQATIENISQQGARLVCDGLFAIEQNLQLDGEGLKEVRAKVRWRGDGKYGVVFDDTFSLADFAKLAAHLQSPALLEC